MAAGTSAQAPFGNHVHVWSFRLLGAGGNRAYPVGGLPSAVVLRGWAVVHSAFNGAGPVLSIGLPASPGFLVNAQAALGAAVVAPLTLVEAGRVSLAASDMIVTLGGTGTTVGVADLILEFAGLPAGV